MLGDGGKEGNGGRREGLCVGNLVFGWERARGRMKVHGPSYYIQCTAVYKGKCMTSRSFTHCRHNHGEDTH